MPPKSDMLVKLLTGIWRVDASGRWYPNIQGGSGEEEETEDETDDSEEERPRTFTQRQVNKMMATEKREGKAQAAREIAEQLGCSIEDAKTFIEEAKERTDKADDDAAKRLRKAEERERKAEDREQKAIRKTNEADVLAALIGEQMPKAKAVKALRMVDVDLSEADLTADEIDEAVMALKDEMPELFGETETKVEEKEWRPTGSPDSTARGGTRRRPQTQTAKEKAAMRLAKEFPKQFSKT